NPLAICHGRSRAIRICWMRWFGFRRGYGRLPEQFAVPAIEANERAAIAERLSYENAIAPDNGRRITALCQGHAPLRVIRRAPADGQILLVANASSQRSSPGRPVRGSDTEGKQEKREP